MSIRDFLKAANLFLETISTFTSYELMDYDLFVKYAVYCRYISSSRHIFTNFTKREFRFQKFKVQFKKLVSCNDQEIRFVDVLTILIIDGADATLYMSTTRFDLFFLM